MSRRAAALNRTRCGAYGSSLPARSRALPQTPPARAWQRPRPRASPQAPCPAPSCRVSGARLAEPSAAAPPLGTSRRLQRAPVRVVGGPSGFSRSFALTAPFSLRCCLSFSHRELVFRRPAWRHSRSSLRVYLGNPKCQRRENDSLRYEGSWAARYREVDSCRRAPHRASAGGAPAGARCRAATRFRGEAVDSSSVVPKGSAFLG